MSITYPLYVPDFITWDKTRFDPSNATFAPDPYRDNPEYRKSRKATSVVWFWALLRGEMTRQRTNRVVLPEPLMRLTLFGAKKPKDASSILQNAVARAGMPGWRLASTKTRCVERCALYTNGKDLKHLCGIPTRRHRHYVGYMGEQQIGALLAFQINTGDYADAPDGTPERRTFFWRTDKDSVVWANTSQQAIEIRERRRHLWCCYYPVPLLGQAAGLSESCIRLFSAATRRIRFDVNSTRTDYGVLVPSDGVFGPNSDWIPCDANAKENRNNYVWNWLRLAAYRSRSVTEPGKKEHINRNRTLNRFVADLHTLQAYGLGWVLTYEKRRIEFDTFAKLSIDERMRCRLDLGLREDWLSAARTQLELGSGLHILKLPDNTRSCGIRAVTGTDSKLPGCVVDSLREKLISARLKRNISVEVLALEAGVTRNSLRKYISGKTKIHRGTREKLETWLRLNE